MSIAFSVIGTLGQIAPRLAMALRVESVTSKLAVPAMAKVVLARRRRQRLVTQAQPLQAAQ